MAVGMSLKGRKVVVVGANPSGFALVKFLLKKGALVKLVDMRPLETVTALIGENLDTTRFALECGDFSLNTFMDTQTVITTPTVQSDSKILEAAKAGGMEVIGELEFAAQFIEEPIVAIIGTNGKSTTASLCAAILENSGKSVFHNLQNPISHYLNLSKPADVVLLVCNNFQLESVRSLKAKVIVATNFSEDYMTRYPTLEHAFHPLREAIRNVDDTTTLVFNAQDPAVLSLAPARGGQTRYFSNQPLTEGEMATWYTKNQLFVRTSQESEPWSFNLTNMRLRGPMNKENLGAAILAALSFGASKEAIEKVIGTHSALPGRLEFIKRMNSVAFYDDSHGVNVQAAIRSLQAFVEPVILISGGQDKNQDYTPLIPHIRQRVKNLILVGEAKEKMNRAIGDFTETFLVGTVEEAVILAYQKSRSGDVVLFSPTCAPYDTFPANSEKGTYYKKLVNQIAAPRRPTVF